VHGLRLAALRGLYRVAYRLLQLRGRVWRGRGRGVKCILTHQDEVLLVRHTYGQRKLWLLPGGVARRGEPPLQTAAREMREELAVADLDWHELARADLLLGRISVDVTCLQAELPDPTVRPDPVEIEHVGWFKRDRLPRPLSSEDRRLLGLVEGWGTVVGAPRHTP
jgi:ADP-ribose pyrophosphatase YjhB (NUDIX family)